MSRESRDASGVGAGSIPPALLSALQQVLKPLVHLLLRFDVTFPLLSNMLKAVYVEAATEQIEAGGKKRQTASAISVLTGVHRKDVKRLRDETLSPEEVPKAVSLGAKITQAWISAAGFQDAKGRPLPLPRGGAESPGPTFDGLVESVTRDVAPRSILDEWLRIGVAELDDDGRVRLRADGFVPKSGFDEQAFYFGRNVRDHVAAAAHNLEGDDSPLLERSVYYEALSEESTEELEALAEELSMDTLRKFNKRAAALKRKDARKGGGKRRVTLGAFFYNGDTPEAEAEEEEE